MKLSKYNKTSSRRSETESLGLSSDSLIVPAISRHQTKALCIVAVVTGSMFVVEMSAGLSSGSKALQADALDFLDDALVYCASLSCVGANNKTRAVAAVSIAVALSIASIWVLGMSVVETLQPGLPNAYVMGAIALLAAAVNAACGLYLRRHVDSLFDRQQARNIIDGNVAVVIAAILVWTFQSPWPDLCVAILASGVALYAALASIGAAVSELRQRAAR